jgi:hypothetical protein
MAQWWPEKRPACGRFCCGTGNFGVKPGLVEGVFQNVLFLTTFSGISMNFLVVEALVSIALALSALMAKPWVVRQRTGNCGWVGCSFRCRRGMG